MHKLIFDACTISNFALSGSFGIIEAMYQKTCCMSDFVLAEIIRGIQKGHDRLEIIAASVNTGVIPVISMKGGKELEKFRVLSISLGAGEASSIAIASSRGMIFACDDRAARKEAGLSGVKLTGTIGILVKAVKENIVSARQADKILSEMTKAGFFSPVKTISEVIKKLD